MDLRVAAFLLLLNVALHFIPLSRPGFQGDDFLWARLAQRPEGGFNLEGLSLRARPLGTTLFMAIPYVFGLHEESQLALLILATSLFTLFAYASLAAVLDRSMAALSGLLFVAWPVKHEIYSSQLMIVISIAACLALASGLVCWRFFTNGSRAALSAAALLYLASILTYEIGYLAPLVFLGLAAGQGVQGRRAATVAFLIPALGYWVLRSSRPAPSILTGQHPASLEGLMNGVPSLFSNLLGFQVARNVVYGWWAIWTSTPMFQLVSLVVAATAASLAVRWARSPGEDPPSNERIARIVIGGLGAAAVLMAPAAMVLVESRQSILSSIAIGAAIASAFVRAKAAVVWIVTAGLCLAANGLAFRQAELSALQAGVRDAVVARRPQMESASLTVVDLQSLSSRLDYTWGDRSTNGLRAYWGMAAFSPGGFSSMVSVDALPRRARIPLLVCASPLIVVDDAVRCERDLRGRPFSAGPPAPLVIGFSDLPLPETIDRLEGTGGR